MIKKEKLTHTTENKNFKISKKIPTAVCSFIFRIKQGILIQLSLSC